MTTPYAYGYGTGQPPVQFPVTTQATLCWNSVPNSGLIGFENTDTETTIYLGQSAAMAPGDANSIPLDPLAFITLPGNAPWYVVAATVPTGDLLIMPGAETFSASPEAIAQAMIDVGVADAIAQAILGTGLPLVPNPTMLYNVSGTQPAPGLGLIGFTIPNQALKAGCYANTYGSQAAADTAMVGILKRPQGGSHPTFTKKFWNTISVFTLPLNDMQNYGAFGTKVACCLKPVFYHLDKTGVALPPNTNFMTTTLLTASQRAQAVTDFNGITTFFNTLLGTPYNFTTAQLSGVFYQEPEVAGNNMTPTDYQNVLFTYVAAATAAGIGIVADIGSGAGAATATSYANAAVASGVPLAGLAQDFYMTAWLNGVTLDAVGSVADANNLSFGVYELGCAPGNFGSSGEEDCTNYLLGQHSSGGQFGILDYMAARIQANKPNLDCEYYMGQCDANGAGDLTSPIGLDPTVTNPDFRIGLYEQIFDTLTASPATPFTIPATHTTTMPPISPSPIGGLAPANYLSYELALGLQAGVGSTNPFAQVIIQWYDFDQVAKDQTFIDEETWYVPMGANGDPNGPLFIAGGGRMRGNFMLIKINNQDTVTCTVNYMQVAGTSRMGKRSQWLWTPNSNTSPAVPTFTLAKAATGSLQLGREEQQNLAAGMFEGWINGLWAGQAFVRVLVSGVAAANTVHFQIQPQPTGVFGTENILNESMGIPGQNDERTFTIALPRCTTQTVFNNNDANTVNVSYQIIGIETA